jgi:aryl-alcohol dehydrogenase-like predicted oxidoreductase
MKQLDTDQMWKLVDVLGAVASRHETTHAAVALAWLLARSEVSTIIVGARTVEQWNDNLRALDVKLTDKDLAELDEVSRPEWGYPYSFIARMQSW